MVFEDLDASGFPVRKKAVSLAGMQLRLNWLAHFHATFLGESPRGLPNGREQPFLLVMFENTVVDELADSR